MIFLRRTEKPTATFRRYSISAIDGLPRSCGLAAANYEICERRGNLSELIDYGTAVMDSRTVNSD